MKIYVLVRYYPYEGYDKPEIAFTKYADAVKRKDNDDRFKIVEVDLDGNK